MFIIIWYHFILWQRISKLMDAGIFAESIKLFNKFNRGQSGRSVWSSPDQKCWFAVILVILIAWLRVWYWPIIQARVRAGGGEGGGVAGGDDFFTEWHRGPHDAGLTLNQHWITVTYLFCSSDPAVTRPWPNTCPAVTRPWPSTWPAVTRPWASTWPAVTRPWPSTWPAVTRP